MSEVLLTTGLGVVATLISVGFGSWLSTIRERQSSRERRAWDLADSRRGERRDVYVRFLNAADRAMHQAWETGRVRTTVFPPAEGQQHYLDWMGARTHLDGVLTEVRLAGPEEVHARAADVVQCVCQFGDSALLAGTEDGMVRTPVEHQQDYDRYADALLDAMQRELAGEPRP
jgi:hypothetical protein